LQPACRQIEQSAGGSFVHRIHRLAIAVAGDGPEYRRLKAVAGSNIAFLGRVPDESLRELYAGCRALVLPGEEDFGLTPVEALASGKPVIALGRGGVLESVPASGGVFYDSASDKCLETAIERFENIEAHFRPSALQAHARRFSPAAFTAQMAPILETGVCQDADLRSTAYSGSENR
jgi:glycosyltransferase involved in cell wall biosynthesis